MSILTIAVGEIRLNVKTLDTATAIAIMNACPMSASLSTWGDEVYFPIPVNVKSESNAKSVVEPGEIAYWPDGNAIAIGFGPTPLSRGREIRLASPCNIWGRALDDVKAFAGIQAGVKVTVDLAKEGT